MASAWIQKRSGAKGSSFRVVFRVGGREAPARHAGAFRTEREAKARKAWVLGELASMRVPDVRLLTVESSAPTFANAAAAWRETRVDVTESTRVLHRVALNRAMPTLGTLRVDAITVEYVVAMVSALAEGGAKRETIRKTVKYVASVLDDHGRDPNPARDKRVRLPHEEREELSPPSATHVEAVYRLLPSVHRLPMLWLDWSGARVSSVDTLLVGDYDVQGRRVRLRGSTTKTRAPLWVELHPDLADALEEKLGPREDRHPEARLFAGSGADAIRTSIAKACRAAGVPLFSPHDLRHRRISLLHAQGRSWAEIGRFVGQRKLSVTADTYTHVLVDSTELDYERMSA
jgi:integrase